VFHDMDEVCVCVCVWWGVGQFHTEPVVGTANWLSSNRLGGLFLQVHREASSLTREENETDQDRNLDQFRFLCTVCLAYHKGSVGLILSVMRISIYSPRLVNTDLHSTFSIHSFSSTPLPEGGI
jgi:hypothetical protein